MLTLHLFLQGLVIGFCIAAPVGPIGVLCINRALQEGFKAGFITGCGAATADGMYGLIAGFGLTFISSFLIHEQSCIRIIGGLFLIYLGMKTFIAKPSTKAAPVNSTESLARSYFSTFFLTATNPMTILSFIAIFSGLGLGNTYGSYLASCMLVLGVIVGSLSWWLILTFSVAKIFHHRMHTSWLSGINRLSGSILILFGFAALISLLKI